MENQNHDLVQIVKESHEAYLLKTMLQAKLKSFCGITHAELTLICEMFNITEEGDVA